MDSRWRLIEEWCQVQGSFIRQHPPIWSGLPGPQCAVFQSDTIDACYPVKVIFVAVPQVECDHIARRLMLMAKMHESSCLWADKILFLFPSGNKGADGSSFRHLDGIRHIDGAVDMLKLQIVDSHEWKYSHGAWPRVVVYTERLDVQTLETFILECGNLNFNEIRRQWAALVDLIAHMHNAGQAHGHLSPQNVCVEHDGNLRLRMFHPDISASVEQDIRACRLGLESNHISIWHRYKPPESLLGVKNSCCDFRSSDIWALGCIFLETLCGTPAFAGADDADILLRIVKVLGPPSPDDLDYLGPAYYIAMPHSGDSPTVDRLIDGRVGNEIITFLFAILSYSNEARMSAKQVQSSSVLSNAHHSPDFRIRVQPKISQFFSLTGKNIDIIQPSEPKVLIVGQSNRWWESSLDVPIAEMMRDGTESLRSITSSIESQVFDTELQVGASFATLSDMDMNVLQVAIIQVSNCDAKLALHGDQLCPSTFYFSYSIVGNLIRTKAYELSVHGSILNINDESRTFVRHNVLRQFCGSHRLEITMFPSKQAWPSERVECKQHCSADIDLSLLLSGFTDIFGWYHLQEKTVSGRIVGQIQVRITPSRALNCDFDGANSFQ